MDPNQQIPTPRNSTLQQPIDQIPTSGNKSGLILLILILLIIIFGGGTYYLGVKQNKNISQNQQKVVIPTIVQSPTPTPNPTANWKTYTSKYNTYSIKYPASWYIYEYKQGGGTGISDIPNPENFPQTVSPRGHTSIIVGELLPGTSVSKDPSSKQFSINTYEGFRRDQTTSYGAGEVVDFNNPNGGNNIELTKYFDDNNMFDQILSTFKFTNQ